MDKNSTDEISKTVNAHWRYIDSVIRNELGNSKDRALCLTLDEYCDRIGLHYRSAMIHGIKHGIEMGEID